MTRRTAFAALGLAFALLPGAGPAWSDERPAASAAATDQMSGGFNLDFDRRDIPAAGRADVVRPLPPSRPNGSATPDAPVSASADATPAPEDGRLVTMVLPPLRPSVAAADEGAAVQARPVSPPAPPPRPENVSGEVDAEMSRVEIAVLPPVRPSFPSDPDPVETGSIAAPPPARSLFGSLFATPAAPPSVPVTPGTIGGRGGHDGIDDLIAAHARRNDVPEDLVHRIVTRESRYNPRAVGRGGALGLMQIKHATARALGYEGPASGLLDADTNLTYAVKYLAGAYRTAGGNYTRAVSYYAQGYYYAAKRLRRDEADAPPERRAGRREAASTRVRRAASLAVADNGRIERLPDVR